MHYNPSGQILYVIPGTFSGDKNRPGFNQTNESIWQDKMIKIFDTIYPQDKFTRIKYSKLDRDGARCYKYTLAYLITNDTKYAEKVLSIFDSWASNTIDVYINYALYNSWFVGHVQKSEQILKYKRKHNNDNLKKYKKAVT